MKLKPIHTIAVLVTLILCSAWASYRSYDHTRKAIISDMNQALAQTLAEKQEGWITPDTIRDYRSHLKVAALRECSFVYYAMDDTERGICSRKMRWQQHGKALAFQGYANCSMATVFALSDQRASGMLSLLAMLWAVGSLLYFRRHHVDGIVVGSLVLSNADNTFYDINHKAVKFTPMQEQLMRMFFASENHCLSKQEICEALWPKKPDASETLYTLIRRLKPITETQANLEIVTERGKDYQLRVKV